MFDLGGTLIDYYEIGEFPRILHDAISNVTNYLKQHDLLIVPEGLIWQRVLDENYESRNHRVRPLERRLSRIFELDKVLNLESGEIVKICRLFMQPIFNRGKCYGDTEITLQKLRAEGLTIVVVSNTPWGSPSVLWREELEKKNLRSLIDLSVFCRDVGWRKPAKPIFEYVLRKLGVMAKECVFVGDDPRWDIVGPKRVGMDAILIDRKGDKEGFAHGEVGVIKSLSELREKIE